MTPDDFALTAVPLRGPLAPIAALLSDGDGVLLDGGDMGAWWGRIGTPSATRFTEPGWVWVEVWCWCYAPISRLDSVDLTTSPAARSAVVAWLEEQGYTAAHTGDEALLIALRAVCGFPAVVPPVDCDDDPIPF